jgi:hypothetical protein
MEEEKAMVLARFILMGFFSLSAVMLISYQGIEIFQAYLEYFRKN